MRNLLLILIGICFCRSSSGQVGINLKYKPGVKLDSLFNEDDTISSCTLRGISVKGRADFPGTLFTGPAIFSGASFLKGADFPATIFTQNANFNACHFAGNVSFEGTRFSGKAIFRSTMFSQRVDFVETIFKESADFPKTIFSKEAVFFACTFSERASFSGASFSGIVDFSKTIFSKSADFSNTTFSDGVDFLDSQFSNRAIFTGATFSGLPSFLGVQLPDTLRFESTDLQNVKSNIFLTLTRVDTLRAHSGDTNRKSTIFLWHTDASKLVLGYEKFRLGFDESVVLDERIGTYQQVIKKCKDLGMEASAQGFDIDLQTMKLENRWGWASPAFTGFQTYWWNFGYDRSKILRNTLYAFLVSFIIFLIGYRRFFVAYFPSEQLGIKPDRVFMPAFNHSWTPNTTRSGTSELTDRIKITFFYTALIFFGWKMDHSKLSYRAYPWTALLVYLIYIIGLIHLAYLAGFVIAR